MSCCKLSGEFSSVRFTGWHEYIVIVTLGSGDSEQFRLERSERVFRCCCIQESLTSLPEMRAISA